MTTSQHDNQSLDALLEQAYRSATHRAHLIS